MQTTAINYLSSSECGAWHLAQSGSTEEERQQAVSSGQWTVVSKQIAATGKMYRGVLITTTAEGCVIFDESGREFHFLNWNEATAFVDAWFVFVLHGDLLIAA